MPQPSDENREVNIADILANARQVEVKIDRQAPEGWRSTKIVDRQYVVKEFTVPAGEATTGPWSIEHTILSMLREKGFHCPRSLGYLVKPEGDMAKVTFCKEFVEGTQLERFTLEDMAEVARFFATLHRAGIITNDPFDYNFIRTAQGAPLFIDFGKAELFKSRGLLYQWRRAREGLKFYRGAIHFSKPQRIEFVRQYRACFKPNLLEQSIAMCFIEIQLCRRYLRNLLRGRPIKS